MTVNTTDVALCDLPEYPNPPLRDCQDAYCLPLHFGISMIEFENKHIRFAAIDAGMGL
jgi:hypothetical protein